MKITRLSQPVIRSVPANPKPEEPPVEPTGPWDCMSCYPRKGKCSPCGGTGKFPIGSTQRCNQCTGSGKCYICGGDGKLDLESQLVLGHLFIQWALAMKPSRDTEG